MTEKEGVLTIKDDKGELIAIVYLDLKKRAEIIYECKPMGMDQIKELLDRNRIKKEE